MENLNKRKTKLIGDTGASSSGSGVTGEKEFMALSDMDVDEPNVGECMKSDSASGKKAETGSAKRRRTGEVDVAVVDELISMRSIGSRLRQFLFSETSKVSKSASEFILNCVGEYEEQLMRVLVKNERLNGKLDECASRVGRGVAQKVSVVGGTSYAGVTAKTRDVIALKKGSNVKKVKEGNFAIVIKAKDESMKLSSEQVKEKVIKDVSKTLNIRVKAVRKIRSGGILVETVSEKELLMIKDCRKFEEVGLSVAAPRKIGPKVIVYDVPNEMTSEKFLSEFYEKNTSNLLSKNEFSERVKIISRGGKKGAASGNIILEVPSCVASAVCLEERVFVSWQAFRVREFVNVLRCHKCYAYGHMMRDCSVKDRLCQRCGMSGHLIKDCKKDHICRNCELKGNKCNHSVMAVECPEYKRALERERARINDD